MVGSIKIGQLVSELTQDEITRSVTPIQIANLGYELLRLLGNQGLSVKTTKVDVVDHIGILPEDCIAVKAIEYKDRLLPKMTSYTPQSDSEPSYLLTNGSVQCSFKEGEVTVVYEAIQLDGEGMPMFPDDIEFLRALKAYIKMDVVRSKVYTGKIHPSILNLAQQEYAWAVGQASRKKTNPDTMEAILKAGMQGGDWHRRKFR